MPLHSGDRLGPYEVLAPLGQGGMGEVYRARDTTLDRDVAIKILPESFASDPDRLMRFEREAKTLASLNHPNIAAIYGLESTSTGSGQASALVMELVEGEDLSARIARGALPLDEAAPIARQIAEALEAAHEAGIIHRDLKPANIKVRPDGTVKVLDFGLAKAIAGPEGPALQSDGGPDLQVRADSPTMTSPAMTAMGVILGTAAYMSPEQAKGRAVDRRADIWAFGVVFYEMLTGKGLFRAETLVETLAQVMTREPDLGALPATVPPSLRGLLARCLDRDPRRRLRDIGEARVVLESPLEIPAVAETAATTPTRSWPLSAVVGAVALALGLVAGALWLGRAGTEPAGTTRLAFNLPPDTFLYPQGNLDRPILPSIAVSRDGQQMAFVAGAPNAGDSYQLYLRAMDQTRATPVPGTENANLPVFSPDGRALMFLDPNSGLKRVDLATLDVRPIVLSEVPQGVGPSLTWTDDDRLLLEAGAGVMAVPAGGGTPAPLTTAEPGVRHRFPQLLPGGRALLFNVERGQVPSNWDIVVEELDTHERRVVIKGGSYPKYVPSGHILFVRRGSLVAVPFDVSSLKILGEEAVVVENVMQAERGSNDTNRNGTGQYAVSDSGTLAYLPGGVFPVGAHEVFRVGRDGQAERLPMIPADRNLGLALSADGTKLAWDRGPSGEREVWVLDFRQGAPRRLAAGGDRYSPVWSPDGTRLLIRADDADGTVKFEVVTVDGGVAPAVLELDGRFVNARPTSWSATGQLAFVGGDIWAMPADGSAEPQRLTEGNAREMYPTFSPDGQWLAYSRVEAGPPQIFVRHMPDGNPIPVTSNGGIAPAWSRDGKELFYLDADNQRRMMAVPLSTDGGFRLLGEPRLRFEFDYASTTPSRSYDVAPGGFFYMARLPIEIEPEPVSRIEFVLNWFDELRRVAPARR